jgi:hypothetical protein
LLFSHENYSQSMLVPCLPPDRVAEADGQLWPERVGLSQWP